MAAIYVSFYSASTALILVVLVLALRRSAYGVLLASSLIWFLVGACVYPLFDSFGLVQRGSEVHDFIAKNGEPGLATSFHILLAAAGIFCGYIWRPRNSISDHVAGWASEKLMGAGPALIWRWSIALGIVSYLAYFYLVGFDVALMNASAARGGDFTGFGENDKFLFLKTVAAIGFVSTCFLPLALLEKNKVFIVAYGLLLATAYANSISRNLLLYGAIIPVLVYLRLKPDILNRSIRPSSYLVGFALIPIGWLVLNYGKVMGQVLRAYFSGDYYSLSEEVGDVNVLDVVLGNFGFQWVSVQAGIDHFYETGMSLITLEQLLSAVFGAVPSRILSFFGLDFLYYGNLSPTLACVNSAAFGYYECTVPPLTIGYSAYLLPGAGGFLLGFFWMRIYVAIERLWMEIQNTDPRKLWIPYFMFGAVMDFFTFLPTALALAAAQIIWVLILSKFRFNSTLRKGAAASSS